MAKEPYLSAPTAEVVTLQSESIVCASSLESKGTGGIEGWTNDPIIGSWD